MKAIVLAAGKGTRLMSEKFNLPKVLRELNGKPLLEYVLENINFVKPEDTVIIVGYMADKVRDAIAPEYVTALQAEQKGTGHAVMSAEEALKDYDGDILILCGDMPLVRRESYQAAVEYHEKLGADMTLLTCEVDKPLPYGRIIRDENGSVVRIVEEKDATEEEKAIRELNPSIYVVKSKVLFEALKKLNSNNAQGEYYLTDVPGILIAEGKKVEACKVHTDYEMVGINTPEDLAFCEEVLKNR